MHYDIMGLARAVVNVLGQFKRPLSLEEIAFRLRTSKAVVGDVLSKLVRNNTVSNVDGNFKLTKEEYKRWD
jgi:DNA-binding IscR family transcriptional regulator